MKILWVIIAIFPGSFFFHFYETTMHNQEADINYSFIYGALITWSIVAGALSMQVRFSQFLLINAFMILLSILLAELFITPPNPSWFNPFTMNVVIVLSGLLIVIGQSMARLLTKAILNSIKKEANT
ncbi:hypothetical protein ABC345_05865 [Shouchella sp. 1P09AA]|uniref:hypothetical protein n=1 Tax=unclassified Shouchella TaxID=2893065 RepID=UPI0039A35B61